MGYSKQGSIEKFWPDDTETAKYLSGSISLEDLQDKIHKWWPDAKPGEIEITLDYIHTDCLTYDRYDAGDYTNFLIIQYCKEK